VTHGALVLVDTSVWIRALGGREPWRTQLDDVLNRNEAVGHNLVYGDLLIGNKGGRTGLLENYARITQAPAVRHEEVVAFVRHHRLHGRGAGWIDIHLLASAIAARMKLWTTDPRLDAISAELGVRYAG
jgi:predicted nucleic acid-binding protein